MLSGRGEPWRWGGEGGVGAGGSVNKESKSVNTELQRTSRGKRAARVSPRHTRESRGNHVPVSYTYTLTCPTRPVIPSAPLNTHAQTRTPHSCNHHSQNVRKDVSTHIPRIHPRQSLGSQREHCRCPAGGRSRCRYRRQGMHRDAQNASAC